MVAVRLFGCIVVCCWVWRKKKEEIDCPRLNWVIDLFFFFGEFFDEMWIV